MCPQSNPEAKQYYAARLAAREGRNAVHSLHKQQGEEGVSEDEDVEFFQDLGKSSKCFLYPVMPPRIHSLPSQSRSRALSFSDHVHVCLIPPHSSQHT